MADFGENCPIMLGVWPTLGDQLEKWSNIRPLGIPNKENSNKATFTYSTYFQLVFVLEIGLLVGRFLVTLGLIATVLV